MCMACPRWRIRSKKLYLFYFQKLQSRNFWKVVWLFWPNHQMELPDMVTPTDDPFYELLATVLIQLWQPHWLFKRLILPKLVHVERRVRLPVLLWTVTSAIWFHWTWFACPMMLPWARLLTVLPRKPNSMTGTSTCPVVTVLLNHMTLIGRKWNLRRLVRFKIFDFSRKIFRNRSENLFRSSQFIFQLLITKIMVCDFGSTLVSNGVNFSMAKRKSTKGIDQWDA